MTKILVDKMPETPKDCPFFIEYRKQNGEIIGHRCMLMSNVLLQADVSNCNYLTTNNKKEKSL